MLINLTLNIRYQVRVPYITRTTWLKYGNHTTFIPLIQWQKDHILRRNQWKISWNISLTRYTREPIVPICIYCQELPICDLRSPRHMDNPYIYIYIQGVPKKTIPKRHKNKRRKSVLVCRCVVTYHLIPSWWCNILLLEWLLCFLLLHIW